jgi:hypothetical protein
MLLHIHIAPAAPAGNIKLFPTIHYEVKNSKYTLNKAAREIFAEDEKKLEFFEVLEYV